MNKSNRTIIKIPFLFVFALILSLGSACGQSKSDKIDELLNRYASYGKFNGSVLVAEKGKIIYKKGFGFANIEWAIPNQPGTKHRLASVSKQFTAMLIMQLVSENKLKLDVPISTYLPDYPKKTADVVTIHHLLTHSSGIADYTSFPNFREAMRNPHRPEEIVALFANSDLDFIPGEKFQYSNSGYILLGCIIEKVTGKSYEEVLQNKIFTPLQMNNSGYDHNKTIIKNRALGYEQVGNTFQNANYIDMSFPFSAGGLYATVEDLYLWDQALYTEKLLPKKYLDLIFEKHIKAFGPIYYGYGWNIGDMPVGNTAEKVPTFSHEGGINGFNTIITRMPTDHSLIVLLNNTSGAPLDEITSAINGIMYDKPYDFPKKSIAYSLTGIMEKDGNTAALAWYKAVKDSGTFALDEDEMNLAGYQLLQAGKATEAAFVFKLNAEAYPKSFNVYDSYGEALMLAGHKEEAIANYLKSVKLNPGNENGLKKLKELGVNTDTLIKKVSIEHLKLLAGEYISTSASDKDKYWKIVFNEVNGKLVGNDRGYKYTLVPVGDNAFINPDDGASLVFDTKDKHAISLVLFGKFKFRKVEPGLKK